MRPGSSGRAGSVQPGGSDVVVPSAEADAQWDAYLARTPGGHHLQSTYWARTKSLHGWRSARVAVTEEGRIRGGAQLLFRAAPGLRAIGLGSIGYVSRGPVLESGDVTVGRRVLDGIDRVARDHRALLLVVQPPVGHEAVTRDLELRGFSPAGTFVEPHPTATVVVDVTADDDALLAAMNRKTRYNVRLAQRSGVVVREGGEADVPTFHRLLTMTGRRQGFAVPTAEYLDHMLRVTTSGGRATILVAECEGEPVSAALLIGFGDTVVFKRGAWSGEHGPRHPNELMHWTALRWARREGYRYYDFEGIDAAVAARVVAGVPGGNEDRRSVSTFKLGFGGRVVLSPGAYERIDNPLLRRGYQWLLPRLLDYPPARRLADAVRTR